MWDATLLDHSALQILTLEGMYSLSNHLINKLIMIKKVAPRDEYHKGMQRRQPPSHQGMITPTRAPFMYVLVMPLVGTEFKPLRV